MKILHPSFAPPEKWRNPNQSKELKENKWQMIRQKILSRDKFTCVYCGYCTDKYQIVDHIDGDPENNDDKNLQVICQMCNLIKHAGQGCVIHDIVDLYEGSKYSQNEIIRITREMRDRGASDNEIVQFLGLKNKVPFEMEREYLKKLYGFVTSRRATGDMYNKWLDYHYRNKMRSYKLLEVSKWTKEIIKKQ